MSRSASLATLVDPGIPLPSFAFSPENEPSAGRTVRALRTRVFEGPRCSR